MQTIHTALSPSDQRNELNQLIALQTCLTSLQTWFYNNGMALNPDKSSALCTPSTSLAYLFSWWRTLNFLEFLLLIPSVTMCEHTKRVSVMPVPYPCMSPHTCCLRIVHRSRYRRSFGFQSTWLCQLSSLRLAVEVLDTFAARSNSAARIVLQQPSLSSQDTLQQLNWLPVKWQIQFNLASLTYKVLHNGTLSYLSERLHPCIASHTLRSSSSANLYVPRTDLHFGSCSFHIAAPTVWNSLPSTLRSSQTLNTFRKHLKTHLYQSVFNSS